MGIVPRILHGVARSHDAFCLAHCQKRQLDGGKGCVMCYVCYTCYIFLGRGVAPADENNFSYREEKQFLNCTAKTNVMVLYLSYNTPHKHRFVPCG
jgi:hypothetical protein